jgi:hypothetical protein
VTGPINMTCTATRILVSARLMVRGRVDLLSTVGITNSGLEGRIRAPRLS